MVNKMRLILVIFIYFIVECCGVGVDYYLGNGEAVSEENIENTTEPKPVENVLEERTMRRTTMNTSLIGQIIKNTTETDYEKYDDLSEIEERMKEKSSEDKTAMQQDSLNRYDSAKTGLGYDINALMRQTDNQVSKIKSINDILKEYRYRDDDPETAKKMLRVHNTTVSKSKSQNADFKNIVIINNATQEDSDADKVSVDFYNLMPASGVNMEDDDPFTKFNAVSNTWYVPENAKCWDLPILYGELGSPTFTSDVFMLYPGSLKNVKETEEEPSKPTRQLYIPVLQSMNKWCAAGPCYGDHTLCLFSDKENSKLCPDAYVVSTPSMIEQIGLVNTVNSMRNRIANGETDKYKHLPKAADMNQLIYDFDLETMAEAWLRQCLPGPASCSALEGDYVAQLECTKYAKHCCIDSFKSEKASKCIPDYECYVDPIIGCIHLWFWKAGSALTATDVECGHITPKSFFTVQLLWAATNKIGCAYGKKPNGDIRVVCNFSPGAPFYLETNYFCGFILYTRAMEHRSNITSPEFLSAVGIALKPINRLGVAGIQFTSHHVNYSLRYSDIDVLGKIFQRNWIRQNINASSNGTLGMVARLVTKYTFGDSSGMKCDANEKMYESGEPGSRCSERGRRFHALCYDFRDPTPGYRLVAVVAPVALFSLILYDLFSGVVRQTNY
ncbi:uncharacterized protein LOC124639322 [Helicoverpa zea]|uniref:uncharacterized protein LOC124639322 n=1 Tax=Helicoverpa zea TaxID=7113 RepID=UPI001F5AB934|nr:uncharacterized protein LOC124639322 [Helicoverpa zea]